MLLNTTFVVSFLVCCRLEVRCGWAGVVSGLQAQAQVVRAPDDGHNNARNMLSL